MMDSIGICEQYANEKCFTKSLIKQDHLGMCNPLYTFCVRLISILPLSVVCLIIPA
jgi:hypothetical protein